MRICIKHCILQCYGRPPTIAVISLGNVWDSWGLGSMKFILHMNLLHLRRFSTWVYHTHVSALVHPLVHSLLYWSHLIQTWWQYLDKSIFDIASFLALFNNKGWIFQGAISLGVGWFRMQRGALDPACYPQQLGRGANWSYFACFSIFDSFYFCGEHQQILGAMHGAHYGGFNRQSWDLMAERENFVFNPILNVDCFDWCM